MKTSKKTRKGVIFYLIASISIFLVPVVGQTDPLLNGIASHSELGKEQFIAGLYTTTLSDQSRNILLAQEEKRIQVRVTAEKFSSRRFKRMWIEGMAINSSSVELAEQSKNMADFRNMLRIKLIQGDIFTITRSLENISVSLNGALLGEIDDPIFFDLLLRSWIGPVPLSSGFREKLLTNGDVDEATLDRYLATVPTDERIAAVEAGVEQINSASTSEQNNSSRQTVALAPVIEQPSVPTKPDVAAPVIQIDSPTITPVSEENAATVADTSTTTTQDSNESAPEEPVEQVAAIPQPPEPANEPESIFEEDEEEFTAQTLLEQQLYIANLKRWSQKHLKYPRTALNRGYQGNVRLELVLDRGGKIQSVEFLEESKYKTLNKEAQKAVKRAEPFPEMPKILKGDSFTFTLPIAFKLVSQ